MFLRSKFSVLSSELILVVLFVLSLPAITTRIYASDEVEGFAWLHSIAFDRDVSFENEYQYFYDAGQVKNPSFHQTFLERATRTGRRPNFTTIGASVLWAPFYAVGHAVALATGAPPDGLGRPYVAAAAVGSACYGFLAIMLSMAIARRIVGDGSGAALAVWIGTPLLFYMYVTPLFTHACSAFAVALFLWTWLRVREAWSLSGAVALGLAGALMTLVRAQDAFFIAGPGLDFVRSAFDRRLHGRGLRLAVAGAAAFAVAYSPQVLAFGALNGRLVQSEFETRKMSWTAPHAFEVLLSREHGLFAWTPLALVAIVGLVLLAIRGIAAGGKTTPGVVPSPRDLSWIAVCALMMIALQAYIAGAVESWTVAGAFGQRRFVSLTPLLVLGVATIVIAIAQARVWVRSAGITLIALCVWWNLGLMAQFGMHTMDRERVTFRANAWRTFVELPRQAPSIAWQYLTNRASFYGQPPR